MTGNVLVTPRSLTEGSGTAYLGPVEAAGYRVVLGPRGRQPSEDELADLLPGCVGYIAGAERIGSKALSAAESLRVISRNGSGIDNIDLAATDARGIAVLRAIGANAHGVAELAIALILDGLRQVSAADRALRAGAWDRPIGREVARRQLGIVGYGAIGQRVGELAMSLGMTCLAHDPFRPPDAAADGVALVARLADVLATCSIITLHCPPPPDGRPLIGAAELARVPRGAVLVNTARWSLVDRDAIVAALDDGTLSAYATDTFEHEPPGNDPLVAHPRTVVTPHLGAATVESVQRAAEAAVNNLLEALGAEA
jgi:phosphoglycerate dehydrogenase-like enzyme